VALVALSVLLSGCGGVEDVVTDAAETSTPSASASASPTPTASNTPTATPTPTPEPTPAPVAEPAAPEPQPVAEPEPEPEPEPAPEPEPVLVAGPPIWGIGSSGDDVREVQARLAQIQWFNRDPTGYYGDVTAQAVTGFQAKRGIPVNGYVDQRTWDRLVAMTREPSRDELYPPPPEPEPVAVAAPAPSVDSRCLTGRVICIDKSQSVVRWVVDGQVQLTLDARFGSELTPTREGVFSVQNKVRDEVSRLYDNAPMPLAVYFSGGQAVHYSPDFAARGYNGSSHGCVNTRSWGGMSTLFDSVRIGDRVVVYWS
jgi:peptidoglycan hydrolase-like protein with peptidoglycan-binding domain